MKHKSVFSYPICSPFVFLNLFIYLLKNEFFRLECDNYISLVARIQRCGCFSKFKMLVYIRSYRLVELINPLSSFFFFNKSAISWLAQSTIKFKTHIQESKPTSKKAIQESKSTKHIENDKPTYKNVRVTHKFKTHMKTPRNL